MVTGAAVVLLAIVLAVLVGAARIVRAVEPFIVNAVVGLLALVLVEAVLGISVAVTPIALAVVALGGFPGAILVVSLAVLEVAFVP